MSMIFPGMDPYLENPRLWPGVHHALVVYIRDYLRPLITPRYIAAIEERVYVEGPNREIIPDVWVRPLALAESAEHGRILRCAQLIIVPTRCRSPRRRRRSPPAADSTPR